MKTLAATLLTVQLNNTGASLLLEGHHEHAAKTFVQALKLTRCLMPKERTLEQKKCKGKTSSSRVKPVSHNLCSDLCNANNTDSTHTNGGFDNIEGNVNKSSKVEFSNYFVFTKPILIDQDITVSQERRKCLMKLTIIIIFNLGLTHHMIGLQQGPDSSTGSSNLRKAFTLYMLSCKMQFQEDVQLSDLYTMAHLNNLGQIHAAHGNQGMAEKHFSRLLQHLLLYKECSKEDERSHQELEGFFRNTTWLILRGPAMAPAA
jgi:hypothetical protein